MHASIRRYEGISPAVSEIASAIKPLAGALSLAPGFISFAVLDGEAGVLATVSVFEDPAALDQADRLFDGAIRRMAAIDPAKPRVISGKVVYQRGL